MSYHVRLILTNFCTRDRHGRREGLHSGGSNDGALLRFQIGSRQAQKAQRGVYLVDLAAYIDKRRAAAVKECHQLTGQL
jgi:hypothetical protein